MSQPTVLVCGRVKHVRSRRTTCELCGEKVWAAASSPKADHIWCVACAVDMAEPDQKVAPLTARQIEDIRRRTGS